MAPWRAAGENYLRLPKGGREPRASSAEPGWPLNPPGPLSAGKCLAGARQSSWSRATSSARWRPFCVSLCQCRRQYPWTRVGVRQLAPIRHEADSHKASRANNFTLGAACEKILSNPGARAAPIKGSSEKFEFRLGAGRQHSSWELQV